MPKLSKCKLTILNKRLIILSTHLGLRNRTVWFSHAYKSVSPVQNQKLLNMEHFTFNHIPLHPIPLIADSSANSSLSSEISLLQFSGWTQFQCLKHHWPWDLATKWFFFFFNGFYCFRFCLLPHLIISDYRSNLSGSSLSFTAWR